MTHQDIVDRMEALGTERGTAYRAEEARIAKERASLQELCGGLGHLFKRADWPMHAARRACAFCGQGEPAKGGESITWVVESPVGKVYRDER